MSDPPFWGGFSCLVGFIEFWYKTLHATDYSIFSWFYLTSVGAEKVEADMVELGVLYSPPLIYCEDPILLLDGQSLQTQLLW